MASPTEIVRQVAAELNVMAKLLELESKFGEKSVHNAIDMWMRVRETNVWKRIRDLSEAKHSD